MDSQLGAPAHCKVQVGVLVVADGVQTVMGVAIIWDILLNHSPTNNSSKPILLHLAHPLTAPPLCRRPGLHQGDTAYVPSHKARQYAIHSQNITPVFQICTFISDRHLNLHARG